MALTPGTRLGAYEVTAQIGAGGMGEVYRARDTKLGRDVAIKILPRVFTGDADRLGRFEREARLLASLNHPHIGAIYGLETVDGTPALVLELVEGDTLAGRIATRPLPITDALTIATQIADALEAAHERGIVHRDLKPANIKVTPAGVVKVLDFGLAKAAAGGEAGPDLTHSPTVAMGGTRDGVVLGTAAYMSPEQARGKAVDKRTDIWAFGCVLYEMLTGRAAFAGETVTDTLAAVVGRQPDWSALPGGTPVGIRSVLRRCLEKDAHRRFHDAADVRIGIDDALNEPAVVTPDGSQRSGTKLISRAAVMAIVVAALAGASAVWILSRIRSQGVRRAVAATASELRLEIATEPTIDPVSLAISPDGRKLAFVASANGRSLLWTRSLDSSTARPLTGSDGASFPFWSPDAKAVGFFAGRQLKRIDVDVGTIQVVTAAEGGRGGTWLQDGTIIFQPTPGDSPLVRVASAGGQPVPYKSLFGRFPHLLPDGRHFLYYNFSGGAGVATREVYVAAVDGSGPRHLLDADAAAVYSSGHLLFVRGTTLLAQPFDILALTISGSAFPVAGGLTVNGPLGATPLSASARGPIVFRTGTAGGLRQFEWVDRTGRPITKVGAPITYPLSPSLSPDGRFVAFHRTVAGNSDIWLLEAARGVLSRLTSDPTNEFFPVWAPDGSRVAFTSGNDLYEKSLAGGGVQRLLLRAPQTSANANDWSPDGRYLLYHGSAPNSNFDLWVLPLEGDRKPIPVAATKSLERDGQFSPDGRWIAFTSDESGEAQVYVQRFPGSASRVQVSTAGGGMARWRHDGRELFYVALDGRLMSVSVRAGSTRDSFEVLSPVPLFTTRIGEPLQSNSKQQYMVAPDGQRFLMNTIAEEVAPPITIVVNWRPES